MYVFHWSQMIVILKLWIIWVHMVSEAVTGVIKWKKKPNTHVEVELSIHTQCKKVEMYVASLHTRKWRWQWTDASPVHCLPLKDMFSDRKECQRKTICEQAENILKHLLTQSVYLHKFYCKKELLSQSLKYSAYVRVGAFDILFWSGYVKTRYRKKKKKERQINK